MQEYTRALTRNTHLQSTNQRVTIDAQSMAKTTKPHEQHRTGKEEKKKKNR